MKTDNLLFLSCGWMAKYKGIKSQADQIVNGGSVVTKEGWGAEVCNFQPSKDGHVYGFFQKTEGKQVRKLAEFPSYDAAAGCATGLTVVWMATSPEGGRRVVGWYDNATVYGDYCELDTYPSKRHKAEELKFYNVMCDREDAHLLAEDARLLKTPKAGIIGTTPWGRPNTEKPGVTAFLEQLAVLMKQSDSGAKSPGPSAKPRLGAAPASASYTRYTLEYEAVIHPKHHDLQARFTQFVERKDASDIQPDLANVDLRFRSRSKSVLVEVKPCEPANCRYAIRTAMGQLLDYDQRDEGKNTRMIVVGVRPGKEDIELATGNGFSIAYPSGKSFKIETKNGKPFRFK